MFDESIDTQFKVSNNPTLTERNSTMTVIKILNQLQDSYGKPNMMMLFNSNTLFRSAMTPDDTHKMLYYQMEQCQEIQRIGKNPIFGRPDNRDRHPHSRPVKHLPPQGV